MSRSAGWGVGWQEVSDEQWAVLARLFPVPKRTGGPRWTQYDGRRDRLAVPDRGAVAGCSGAVRELELGPPTVRLLIRRRDVGAVLATVQGQSAAVGEVEWTVSVDASITWVRPARLAAAGQGAGPNYTNRWHRRGGPGLPDHSIGPSHGRVTWMMADRIVNETYTDSNVVERCFDGSDRTDFPTRPRGREV